MKSCFSFCIAFLLSFVLGSAEYFVSVKGSDKNSGTSEKTPFRTISHGVRKIAPGDTLTILPGEYLEEAHRDNYPGDPKRPTVIRAKIPGTVHMRGDIPAPRFTKVPGRKNVYMCKASRMPEYVLERDTVKRYVKAPSVSEVEMTAGSFYKDMKNKRIYIHTSDGLAPEFHCITFSVLRGDGIRFRGGRRLNNIHISGIMFSGYNSATANKKLRSTFGGVYLPNCSNCTVRDCIVYLCGSGVIMLRFDNCAVENCIFFANSTEFLGSGGNLVCYGPGKNTVQRNIITFASNMAGQRFYGGTFLNCLIENCFAFDNKYGDIWIKYASDTAVVRGSYASSLMRSRLIENSIFTTGDTYYHGKAKKSICREREPRFDPRKEFADPAHLDFRLQKNSRFRKGGDRGIKGYDPKVVFDNDAKLVSGGTLYLTAPRSKALKLRGLKDIIIRGRGVMPGVIKGDLILENCRNVRFENLNVMGRASFKGTSGLILRRSAFLKDVVLPARSQVRHNLFAGAVSGADGGFLRGNIFCVSYTGKPRFSGWNAYVRGNIPGFEVSSWKAPAPVFNNLAAGDLTLKNHYLFAGRSADGFPTGQYRYDTVYLNNGIIWEKGVISSKSATFLISSAADAGSSIKLTDPSGKSFYKSARGKGLTSVSFAELRPGTVYKAVCSVVPQAEKQLTNAPKSSSKGRKFTFSFTTPKKDRAPRVWHVSPEGNNANDGSTPSKAIAEINAAIKRAAPGDTVLIGAGEYNEQIRVNATGSRGKILTIAGAPGAEVIINGSRMLFHGVQILGKEFVRIDNLTFIRFAGSGSTPHACSVYVRDSSDIHVSRIFHDNRNGTSQRSFVGVGVKNMILENSVAITPFGGYEFWKSPNLEIRNSVFFRGKTINGRIGTSVTAPAHVHHCIFMGQEIQKVKNPTFGATDIGTFKENDNGFLARVPRHEKPAIGFNARNGRILPKNDGGGVLNKEWKKQGRFYNQILKYDDFCKEQNRKATALFGNPRMKGLPYFHQFKSLEHWNKVFYSKDRKVQNGLRNARAKEMQMGKKLRITDFIATAPEFRKRNIGLDPAAFKDFR